MLQAFVITLREGIEAFLIVAISLAYLRKSGRAELIRAVHWGIVAALAVSAVGGYLLYQASNQEWLEGPLALIAAVSVACPDRADVARGPAHERGHRRPSARLERAGWRGRLPRRVPLHGADDQPRRNGNVAPAAAASAGAVSGRRSPPRHRRRVGAGVALVALRPSRAAVAVPPDDRDFPLHFHGQLFIYGIHEMSEQNFLPYSQIVHEATEAWGPESMFGHLLTYLLVLGPLTWLAIKKISLPKTSYPTTSSAT